MREWTDLSIKIVWDSLIKELRRVSVFLHRKIRQEIGVHRKIRHEIGMPRGNLDIEQRREKEKFKFGG